MVQLFGKLNKEIVEPRVEPIRITSNGTYDASDENLDGYSEVVVAVPGDGRVDFVDYDGTLVKSMSAYDILEAESLPKNPTHSGLVSRGWNWSLDELKSYMRENEHYVITVGQIYRTDDDKTRFIVDLEYPALSPCIGFNFSSNVSVTVDWGDGSTEQSLQNNTPAYHTYATGGRYTISIDISGGKVNIPVQQSSPYAYVASDGLGVYYKRHIHGIHIGKNLPMADYMFSGLGISFITIPDYDDLTSIGYCCFQSTRLESITIPKTVRTITRQPFNNAECLKYVSLSSQPVAYGSGSTPTIFQSGESVFVADGSTGRLSATGKYMKNVRFPKTMTLADYGFQLTSLEEFVIYVDVPTNTFNNCPYLRTVIIDSDNQIAIGSNAFNSCTCLSNFDFSKVSSIGSQAFAGAFNEVYPVEVADLSNVTSIGTGAFQSAKIKKAILSTETVPGSIFSNASLLRDVVFTVDPTQIGNSSFQSTAITNIDLGDSCTNIGTNAFGNCYYLLKIEFPATLTRIDSSAFYQCLSLREIWFKSIEPPVIASSIAFYSLDSHCKIYVPRGTLSAYTTATNYPSPSTYTYIEYDLE